MIKVIRHMALGWTTSHALGFLFFAVCLSLVVSFALGTEYARASYVFTVPAGLALSVANIVLAAKLRASSMIHAVTAVIIAVFMLAFALEEIGWAFWRSYIRPPWFEVSLSPFFKSIQSAGMVANITCLIWFFRGGSVERLPVVGLVSAGLVLTIGTAGAILLAVAV